MITISKTFDFDAAHFLPKVAKNHKCRRMHERTHLDGAGEARSDPEVRQTGGLDAA